MSKKEFYDNLFESNENRKKNITDPSVIKKLERFDQLFIESFNRVKHKLEKEKELLNVPPPSLECNLDIVEIIADRISNNKKLTDKLKEYFENHIKKNACPFCQEALDEFKKNSNIEHPEEVSVDALMERIDKAFEKSDAPDEPSIKDIIIEYKNKMFNVLDKIGSVVVGETLTPAELTARGSTAISVISFKEELEENITLEITLNAIKENKYNILATLVDEDDRPLPKENITLIKEESGIKTNSITDLGGTVEFNDVGNGNYIITNSYGSLSFTIK